MGLIMKTPKQNEIYQYRVNSENCNNFLPAEFRTGMM